MDELTSHLHGVYSELNRKWIILFPEGGFLYKRLESSQELVVPILLATTQQTSTAIAGFEFFFYIVLIFSAQTIKCEWGTGIRGLMRGMATLRQGNPEILVVKGKVGRPPGELR